MGELRIRAVETKLDRQAEEIDHLKADMPGGRRIGFRVVALAGVLIVAIACAAALPDLLDDPATTSSVQPAARIAYEDDSPSDRSQELLSAEGLTLRARCRGGDDTEVLASTDRIGAYLRVSAVVADGTRTALHAAGDDSVEARAVPIDLTPSRGDGTGTLVYQASPGGSSVTVTYAWDDNPSGKDCRVVGTAVVSES